MKSAKFDVLAQDHVLLSNFSVKYHVVKEFSVNVTSNTLEITFRIPSKNSFAFLNALEVVSVPDGLITEDAPALSILLGNSKACFHRLWRLFIG